MDIKIGMEKNKWINTIPQTPTPFKLVNPDKIQSINQIESTWPTSIDLNANQGPTQKCSLEIPQWGELVSWEHLLLIWAIHSFPPSFKQSNKDKEPDLLAPKFSLGWMKAKFRVTTNHAQSGS